MPSTQASSIVDRDADRESFQKELSFIDVPLLLFAPIPNCRFQQTTPLYTVTYAYVPTVLRPIKILNSP